MLEKLNELETPALEALYSAVHDDLTPFEGAWANINDESSDFDQDYEDIVDRVHGAYEGFIDWKFAPDDLFYFFEVIEELLSDRWREEAYEAEQRYMDRMQELWEGGYLDDLPPTDGLIREF